MNDDDTFLDLVCCNHPDAVVCLCNILWVGGELQESDGYKPPTDGEVRLSSDDSISAGEFCGMTVVWECDGCRSWLAKYRDFVNDNEELIRHYLRRLADERLAEAKRLADLKV